MDLPKKHSSRYLTGIYALFILLFAFTASLFYTSRCQKSPGLDEQGAENIEQKEAADTAPIKPETTDSPERQAANKLEISESGNKIDYKNIKASPSQKVSHAENIYP